ncbi:hypothetical protein JW721_01070 [Candidatus Micrarchaeota archaeon]|nr:hypothetical protein [Candidatus Micrarchaeota archaeon]
MRGQAAIEELLSLAIYIALISLLLSAVLSLKSQGEDWADSLSLNAKASSAARAYDSFSNSAIPNPDSIEGGGRGYIEVSIEDGGETSAAAVLGGIAEYAEGEPV